MIKKWVEYIKESFEQLTHTEDDVYEYTLDLLNSEIDNIFVDIHQEFNTSSGDITPDQVMQLDHLKEKLARLITDQVCANLNLENLKSDNVDLEQLANLEDERDRIKEGDEVIAVYTERAYIKHVYKFTLQSRPRIGTNGYTLGHLEYKSKTHEEQGISKWYDINDADLVIKVDTYNDFVSDKRL